MSSLRNSAANDSGCGEPGSLDKQPFATDHPVQPQTGDGFKNWHAILIGLIAVLFSVITLWFAAQDYLEYMRQIGLLQENQVPRRVILGLIALLIFLVVIIVWIAWLVWQPEKTKGLARRIIDLRKRFAWLAWAGVVLVILIPLLVLQHTSLSGAFGYSARLILTLGIGMTVALLSEHHAQKLLQASTLIVSWLVVAAVFSFAQALASVSTYPFSLTWSEGNRIWDYSALFGHRFYNYPADKPIFAYLDLGRQSLWGLPFLFARVPIWAMRLWNALLSTLPYAILGWVAFKRLRKEETIKSGWLWFLGGLWAFLFLNQGPIHTPLVLSAILVAFAWRRPLWLAVPLVIVAGYYAQATRFTWIFAPAVWAAMLIFSDVPQNGKPYRRWVDTIIVFVAGLVGSVLLPQWLPLTKLMGSLVGETSVDVPTTGGGGEILDLAGLMDQVGRQPLLWERLLPNPTYAPGILLGAALATIPLILFLVYLVKAEFWKLDLLGKLAILLPAGGFLLVGLVVSVKIGGGGDLHNLDMFLITLLFAAALAWIAGGYKALIHINSQPTWTRGLWIFMVILFAQQAMVDSTPVRIPAAPKVKAALEYIQQMVGNTQGEILFLDQRQLLTFGDVVPVPLVVDYEKKYLMDQAMSENATYFADFHRDLARQRFAVIISEPLKVVYKGQEYHFGDENDAWVKWVSEPILCYYEPSMTFKEVRVQVLVPRENPQSCSTTSLEIERSGP